MPVHAILDDQTGVIPPEILPAIAGPQGPPGNNGAQGLPGDPGQQGIPGNDGQQGPPGNDGGQGIQGVPGNDGAPGIEGPQGQPGADGAGGVEVVILASYRTLLDSTGSHIAARAANKYGLGQGQPAAVTGTGTLYALNTIAINSADYPTVNGLAPKLRVRFNINCNDVGPFTGTWTCGLYPVTRPATSGGAGLVIYTIGTVVPGSTVVGTNLVADSANLLVGADFAIPANGQYVLGFQTSANMATSSHAHISASLQMRNA